MTKIDELIESIITCEQFTMGYNDVCWPDDVKRIMQEYAEHYAKKCLEIAAENVKFEFGEVDVEGYSYKEIVGIDYESLLNIEMPEHETL
jgi:hypothetical protein